MAGDILPKEQGGKTLKSIHTVTGEVAGSACIAAGELVTLLKEHPGGPGRIARAAKAVTPRG